MLAANKIRDEAKSISLQQDVSKGWLVLRYGSASDQLKDRSGFIGAYHLPQEIEHLHALAIRKATETLITELAEPAEKFPFSLKRRCGFTKFMPRFLPKVEAMTADGASDEQLALNLMFGGEKFSGLKIVSRDLAHCMRRVASRTTFADPYLKQVMDLFVHSKKSPCQLIHYSTVFKVEMMAFPDFNQRLLIGSLRLEARFENMVQKDGTKAFGDRLVAPTLAALADAHDEHMVIVRMADTDQLDGVEMQQVLTSNHIPLQPWTHLANERDVWTLLKKEPIILHFEGPGHTRKIGGQEQLTQQVLRKVAARMHLWLTLVKEVVRAELPSFESFNSINALLQLDEDPGDIQEAADRMAHVLNLPADSLMQLETLTTQLFDVKPLAAGIRAQTKKPALECWATAVGDFFIRLIETTQAVQAAVSSSSCGDKVPSPRWMKRLAEDMWSAEHDKELSFNRQKHHKKAIIAYNTGTYVPECPREKRKLQIDVAEHQKAEKKRRKEYEKKIADRGTDRMDFADMRVYVAKDVPEQRAIASPLYFSSAGKKGAFIAYK
ncbi:hypothetical protein AK812_SmicGene23913 [Symbiodinium microadriaticum]|uniref:Uncharacterized protein n=1 Tax=Symbiodinium microadriaticum TaxID=2951 RepID=A0A1Q9DG13_SYMMI|nr:hypothetical protein AK812_SmicGene23913 [Symbiodinium microadriaticum]